MLILLSPSESKTLGGSSTPLDYDTLSFPQLNTRRKKIARSLVSTSRKPGSALKLLKLSKDQQELLQHNVELLSAETAPIFERYSGVAFDALDVAGHKTGQALTPEQQSKIVITSALFGLLSSTDSIPYYRLSAGSKLVSNKNEKTVKSFWEKSLDTALNEWQDSAESADNAIYDLRSGSYQSLGTPRHAVHLRVETEYPDGARRVVSHFNKHYKGLVARQLALLDEKISQDTAASRLVILIEEIPEFQAQGFNAEVLGSEQVLLVVPAPSQ